VPNCRRARRQGGRSAENLYVLLRKKGQWRLDSKKERLIGHTSWQPTIRDIRPHTRAGARA
jgi:hypothetical protein